ncbi:MAG: stage III sporulation protein AG [Clostridia bacterium]|nr:stage III sporulation protein AG [Clostridia bacterium]
MNSDLYIKIKEYFKKMISQKDYVKLAVIVGFLGIFLIFVSGMIPKKVKESELSKIKSDTSVNSETHRELLEKNLTYAVSKIEGAGSPQVLVTLENTAETIYATEERKNKEASEDKSSGEITRKKESDDCEKKYITVKDSEGTEHALAVKKIEPKVKGVVIICPGGDDPIVKNRITEAVTTALSISSKRVCVTKSI